MERKVLNNIRLGVFIIAGLLILVTSLYIIGQNQSFFGSRFSLKARFRNVSGLMPGNNVRFSGIQCGTVSAIEIINDTTIEVRMLISEKTSRYIHSDATASIGTEGLMGNKVINILPGTSTAPIISSGGLIQLNREKGLDDMLNTLSGASDNVLNVSSSLRATADRIDRSPALNDLLTDRTIAVNLRQSLVNFRQASAQLAEAAASANLLIADVKKGQGVAGVLLADSGAAAQITDAIGHINVASEKAERLLTNLDSLTDDVRTDLNHGMGPANLLLKDSAVAKRVRNSMANIETGTSSFSEDMEALKHNFLLRGYFRKQERKKSGGQTIQH